MVEDVSDDILKLQTNALPDLYVLHQTQVHIPVHQAADHADATGPCVKTKNRRTESVQHGVSVREDVEPGSAGVAADVGVQRRRASGGRFCENTVSNRKKVPAIGRAKRLAVGVCAATNRRAAADGENRRQRPTAGDVADNAFLALIEWIFNHGERVEHELAVKALQAILIIEVEGVILGVFAGGLDKSASAPGLTPSEVFLKSDSLPLGYLRGNEQAVVIAVTNAGIDADPGR